MGKFKQLYKEIETYCYKNKIKLPPPIKGYKKYKNFLKKEIKNEDDFFNFVVKYCTTASYPRNDKCIDFFILIEKHLECIHSTLLYFNTVNAAIYLIEARLPETQYMCKADSFSGDSE